jgi:hypothetical protein
MAQVVEPWWASTKFWVEIPMSPKRLNAKCTFISVSIFILLHTHSPKLFMLKTKLLHPWSSNFHFLPCLALVNNNCTFLSINVITVGILCKGNHRISAFFERFISFRIMSSKSIYTLAHAKISILFKAVIYLIVFIHHIKFIFSYISEHLGWIHLSAVVNNSSVTVGVQIFFKNLLMICGIDPWVKKLGHIVT